MLDCFVRPAVVADLPHICQIHSDNLQIQIEQGTRTPLAREVLDTIRPTQLSASWSQALTAPLTSRHLMFTAVAGTRPVGFAAVAPADQPVGDSIPDAAGEVAEIIALEVDGEHGRCGHGSRLLSALADTVCSWGCQELQVWLTVGQEAKTRFFAGAGFGPRGLARTLSVSGSPLLEQCWYAKL